MGSIVSKRVSGDKDFVAVDVGKAQSRWVEEKKTFNDEQSLVYRNSPLLMELRSLLSEPLGQRYLGQFSKHENSSENFFAWIDIEEYKRIPTESYRKCAARNIFQKYIKEGAVMQLGGLTEERIEHYKAIVYPRRATERVFVDAGESESKKAATIEEEEGPAPEVLTRETFTQLQHMVFREMAENTYKRFKSHKMFEEYETLKNQTYNVVDVDDFDYLAMLGKGGFGAVVNVRKKSTGHYYALKFMTKASMLEDTRFLKRRKEKINVERDVYVNNQMPFMVSMHYAFQTEMDLMLVLDFCHGGTLKDLQSRYPEGHVPEDAVRFIAAELMLALQHMHSSNYVHRDLKPVNVLLDKDGHVKLADMGLADRIDETKKVIKRLNAQGKTVMKIEVDNDKAEEEAKEQLEQMAPLNQESNGEEEKGEAGDNEDKDQAEHLGPVITTKTQFVGRRYTRVGTAGYKAPEMLNAKRPIGKNNQGKVTLGLARLDEASDENEAMKGGDDANELQEVGLSSYGSSVDWWSFGVIIFEMLAGQNIFNPKHGLLQGGNDPKQTELATVTSVTKRGERVSDNLPESVRNAVSEDCKSFLDGVLNPDPSKRLGCDQHGFRGLYHHRWFRTIDFQKLLSLEVTPPYDVSSSIRPPSEPAYENFAEVKLHVSSQSIEQLCGSGEDETISERHQKYFDRWDYVAPATFKLEIDAQERLAGGG